jgi:ABC-2 type transport system permease protein
MRAYLAILKSRTLILFQYRAAALAGIPTQVFWGMIKIMVFTAFYATASRSHPLNLSQTTTFIWIGQAFLQLLPWNIDKELEEQIKNGNIAYELARPLDLYWYWFARALAMRLTPTVWRCIPLFY